MCQMGTLCRLCANSCKEAEAVNIIGNDVLLLKIHQYLKLEVVQDDVLPHKACTGCCKTLDTFHTFAQHCQEAQERLKNVSNNSDSVVSNDMEIVEGPRTRQRSKQVRHQLQTKEPLSSVRTQPPKRKSNSVKFTCRNCEKEVSTWNELALHYANSHEDKLPLVSCICGKLIKSRMMMYRHKKLHSSGGTFPCDVCGKCYLYQYLLQVHKKIHVPKSERPFLCPKCPKRFHLKNVLKRHIETHTPAEERAIWTCEYCDKKLLSKNLLYIHRRNIHENVRSHVCHVCGQGFSQKQNLIGHMQLHNEDSPYTCDKCGKSYKAYTSLVSHLKRHHVEAPLVCPVCQVTKPNSHSMKMHMIVHSEARPFICGFCGQSFKRQKNLKTHEATHAEVRQSVPCPYCGKCFKSSSIRNEHTRRVHRAELLRDGKLDPAAKPKSLKISKKTMKEEEDARRAQQQHVEQIVVIPDNGMWFNL